MSLVPPFISNTTVQLQCFGVTEQTASYNPAVCGMHGNRQIDNVEACSFFYSCSILFQLFQSHKCFIDVFEIHYPFIVTHNKCSINVTLRACLHRVGETALVGLVSFVFTLWLTQNKRNLPY